MKGESMKEKIVQTAGEIWGILGERGEVNIKQLPKIVKQNSELTYQALGWLAREDKIVYTTNSGKTYISLTPTEISIHQMLVR